MLRAHSSPTSNSFLARDLLRLWDKSPHHLTKTYRSAWMAPSCRTGLVCSWFSLTVLCCDWWRQEALSQLWCSPNGPHLCLNSGHACSAVFCAQEHLEHCYFTGHHIFHDFPRKPRTIKGLRMVSVADQGILSHTAILLLISMNSRQFP